MKLTNDVWLLDGLPVAYIKSIDTLVLSDMHLGYEGVMANRGVLIPKINLRKIIEMMDAAIKKTGAKNLIVNGDIKNEFSTVGVEEFNELYDFISFTKQRKMGLTLIKGNHDNFVERYREPFNLKVYANEAHIGNYFFFHGDMLPREIPKCEMIFMGHEHPSISIFGATGRRERLKSFLYGKYKKIPLLVLPASCYFSVGGDLNLTGSETLSPLFRKLEVENMHAIVCAYGSTIDFGPLKKLENIQLKF